MLITSWKLIIFKYIHTCMHALLTVVEGLKSTYVETSTVQRGRFKSLKLDVCVQAIPVERKLGAAERTITLNSNPATTSTCCFYVFSIAEGVLKIYDAVNLIALKGVIGVDRNT